MPKTIILEAELRNEYGKGAARRIRREGRIPAVLYSGGETPTHVILPGHETMLALRAANALLQIKVKGEEDQLALPKQIQRNPVTDRILHVDLLKVVRGEKVSVQVPVHIVGEQAEADTLVNQERNELSVLAEATNIPAAIEVSIEGLVLGDQILAGQVKLPAGVELEDDPEALVVAIAAQISEEQLEAELETPEGEDAEAEDSSEDDAADDESADE